MKTRISLFIMLLLFSRLGNSQVVEYFFNQQNDTYTEITGGTELWAASFDNEVTGAVTIPSFTYDGVAYTSLFISANGFITFGSAPAGTNYTPISNTATYAGAISAFGRDLNQAASGSPAVRVQQVGSEFVIQWKDVRRKDISGEIISFQIRLNTSNNYIKVVYGGTITPGTYTTYPQVGLRGPDNVIATNVNNRTIAAAGGNWINSAKGTGSTNTMYFNLTTPGTVPTAGLTYTWKPLYNPTGFISEAVSLNEIDLGWTKNWSGQNVMLAWNTTSTFGTPVNGQVYSAGNTITGGGTVLFYGDGTSFSHTSLSANTVYYYKIWSYDAVTDYSPGVTASTSTGYELPYLQIFPTTSSPAGWTNNMSRAANHGTSLSIGQYERLYASNTSCFATSPLVGSITSSTYLSFHYRFADYLGFPLNATTLGPDDKVEIQVSTDDGANFTTIHTIDQTNHTATTEFTNKVISLSAYSGDFIKVRFLCTWGSGDYNFDMDNILFEDGLNMSYSTSTTEQPNTTNVGIGTTNNDIIRLQVVTQKSANPLYMTSISVTATGEASVARIFYTTTPVFSTATQFGNLINNPGGAFTFNGNQVLAQGNNYFWLAYDIKSTATPGSSVDGTCSGFVTSESGVTKTPAVTTPTGSRTVGTVFTGTKSIPGDYATIAAAVNALNIGVIGAGGVTFNVAGGYSETTTSVIWLYATGTSSNPILFRKNGAGAKPIINRTDAGVVSTSAIGNNGDAVVIIEGSDYVTFDSIDVTASNGGIEYGYYLRKLSITDACKNVTIKNAAITLTKGTSRYVTGICVGNNTAGSNDVSVTSPGGAHENITLTGNTISNVFAGIYMKGSDDYNDQNFTVGASGAGNTIINFGGNAAYETWGIYLTKNNNSLIRYNTINNMTGGGTAFTASASGIFHASTNVVDFTAGYNDINLTSASSQLYGIYSSVYGTLQLDYNTIALANTSSSTAAYAFIYNFQSSVVSSSDITINNNTFATSNFQTTGSTYLVFNSNQRLSPAVISVQNNTVSGTINRTGTSGTFYLYNNSNGNGTGTENISGNNFSNITLAGSSSFNGIYSTTNAGHTQNVFNNTISNITGGTGNFHGIYLTMANSRSVYGNHIFNITSGAVMNGIYLGSGSNPGNIYKNEIYNLSSSSTTTDAGTVNGILVVSGTAVYLYNNFISDLKTPASASFDAIRAISVTPGQSSSIIGIYYNSIYLNATSTGANFGTSGIYHVANTDASFAKLDMRNNLIINNSTPNGSASVIAFRRSTTSTANYALSSNNNIFYAGTPASNRLIYWGNVTKQTIEEYRDYMGPNRDSLSFSEMPPFINSSTAPYNLRLQDGTTNYCESGAQPVTAPVSVTDDYDGAARPGTPDIGADEFSGTSAYVEFPAFITAASLNSQQIRLEFDSNPDDDNVIIVYNATGTFTLPSGTPTVGQPLAGGTVLYTGTTSPLIHSGLTPNTAVYYKAFCHNGTNYSLGKTANATPVVTPVTNLAAVCGGQTAIDLSWTKNIYAHDVMIATRLSYISANPVQGTEYNIGDSVPSAGRVIYKGPLSGFTHPGLNSWTQHYYRAWSVDVFNYYSTGVSANSITDADPVTNFGYEQDFDGTWAHDILAPPQWLVVDVGGSGSFSWIRNSTFERSSPYCAQGYGSGTCNDYLISPPLSLPDTLMQLTWWDKVSASSNINNYKVLLSTTNNLVASFTTELADLTCTNTEWQQHTIDLSDYRGQTVYLAFYQYYTTQQYQTFAIDDIIIESSVPGAASVVFPYDGLLTMTRQTLRWKAPVTSIPIDGYKVYMDLNPNPATLVYDGTEMSFETAELAYNTTYYWKVIAYNENGEAYNVPVWSFTTVTSSQLAESFESAYFPPVSWETPGGGWFFSASSALHGDQSANRFTYNAVRPKIVTPLLDIKSGDKLEFFEGTGSKNNNFMVVCYSADKTDWDTIGDILYITVGSWGHRVLDLSALAGNQYYLSFEVWCAGSNNAYVYIDHVTGPDVVPILPWAATNPEPPDTDTYLPLNLTLHWAPQIWGGIPSGYKVYLSTNPNPTTLIYNGTAESYPVGPLQINTTYYWKVVPYNSLGDAADNIVWSFTTVPDGGVQIGRDMEDYYDLPVYTSYGYNYSQTIYKQSEINIGGKLISKIYYLWNGEEEGTSYKDWVIYMGHTSKTAFVSTDEWVPLAQMTEVFDGEVIIPYNEYDPVWVEIILETPFYYNNTDNLVIAIDENTEGYTNNYGPAFNCTEDTDNRSILFYSDDDNPDPASPPEADNLVPAFPDIRILCESAPTVPVFFCNPALKDYGVVTIYDSIAPLTFDIRNRGVGTLTINGLQLTGTNVSEFNLTDNNTYPVALTANQYISVTVSFNPVTSGEKTAALSITHSAAGSPVAVSLSGTAYDPSIVVFPLFETFEDESPTRNAWRSTRDNGDYDWYFTTGNGGNIPDAQEGSYNAAYYGTYDDSAKLISPLLNLSSLPAPYLYFWYGNEASEGEVNNFRVFYRTNPLNAWVEIFFDNDDVNTWTEVQLSLPDKSSTYQVAFEATDKLGYQTVVDAVRIGPPYTVWIGDISDDWTDPDNWSDGVPGVNHEVIVTAGSYDPVISTTVTVYQVTLQIGAVVVVSPTGSLNVTGN